MVSCKCVVVHCKYIELEVSVDDDVYTQQPSVWLMDIDRIRYVERSSMLKAMVNSINCRWI